MNDPSADEGIRAQFERIVSSRALAGSDQLKRLLRLIVDRTLEGQAGLLKEYNLGLEVFQRPPDYDPKVDPIVRVQMRRLRAKLDEYYAGEGKRDSLVIQIPKGAYAASFEVRKSSVRARQATPAGRSQWITAAILAAIAVIPAVAWLTRDGAAGPANTGSSIAVLPLELFTGDTARGYLADQVAEVLTTGLARSRRLRVVSRTTASRYRGASEPLPAIARALGVRWVVEGGVGVEGSRVYVKLRAVDALTDRKVWADVYDCESSELVAATERAADSIAEAIEPRIP